MTALGAQGRPMPSEVWGVIEARTLRAIVTHAMNHLGMVV